VLYTGAAVSFIIGLLSGSYMGDVYKLLGINSLALSRVVEQVLSTPTTFIVVAVAIGFVHVNIAHVMAFLLAMKAKQYKVVLTKSALFAFELFVALYASAAMLKLNLPLLNAGMSQVYLYGMFASLGALIVGVVMQNGAFGAILWIFELTGLLGDALSYSRLAGVALAGYYLGSAINLLTTIFRGMLPGPAGLVLGTIAAFFVFVFGHLINVLLSILGGFVHSLRLCLVEFMFKFYEGGGTKYSPFSLKTQEGLIIRSRPQTGGAVS
jgi:V/A-type H+-transporting ATPase subunit I